MLFLLLVLGRLFLLASLSSLESAFLQCGVHPFLFMLSLRFSCLSPRCGSRPPGLSPPHDLVFWNDGPVPFLFGKGRLRHSCQLLSVELRPLFPFQQAQYVQVFSLRPVPFCTLFAGLGSTNQSATSLLFCSIWTLVLCSPPSFLLSQTLWQELSSLSPYSIRLQWVPGHSFLPGNDTEEGREAGRSFKREKSTGPRTDPCRTPRWTRKERLL